jgi:hypothetical protein
MPFILNVVPFPKNWFDVLLDPILNIIQPINVDKSATLGLISQHNITTTYIDTFDTSGLDAFLIDESRHPYKQPGTKYFNKLKNKLPIAVLTGYYNQSVPNWVYFSYYFLEANYGIKLENDTTYSKYHNNYSDSKKTYKFSCLNRTPKEERIWFYSKLHQQSFFSQMLTSFYPSLGSSWVIDEHHVRDEFARVLQDEETADYFFKNIYHTLPHGDKDDLDAIRQNPNWFSRDIAHPAFKDTYVNIISEHLYNECFLSEKTVKPIAAEQLFLMAGPPGAIKHIEDMGFDVFRDYIDHDYYDHEPDWKLRLLKLLEVVGRLNEQDIPAIYHATKLRRVANRNHIASNELRNLLFRPLVNWINHAITT